SPFPGSLPHHCRRAPSCGNELELSGGRGACCDPFVRVCSYPCSSPSCSCCVLPFQDRLHCSLPCHFHRFTLNHYDRHYVCKHHQQQQQWWRKRDYHDQALPLHSSSLSLCDRPALAGPPPRPETSHPVLL